MNSATPPIATPRVAAGVLFFDDHDQVLLVDPSYKRGFEVPGGYVEPGESPRAACIREVREELGIEPPIGGLLVVDWAPAADEGDKILFLFDGGTLARRWQRDIALQAEELTGWSFTAVADIPAVLPPRLSRRVLAAIAVRSSGGPTYLEHGAGV
ncbi:NUDIX hydrolase [Frankia sp. AgB1.9]|uniref:NUDIX domain-containing protein n=1 Tax=unclassified Frankia TaxID=2632575 RepID=UPI0019324F94|nr:MULTISPECIES: NUDIX hydrolase [unclassified Frankia]MBL7494541.1 NUDIX hydrolase [Frankia sp. AgW1.1]MBL7551257.1 NUDIX hydrolase [Frankia sp. AgB1.9]MBL7621134.1 NUDIX hydrolase [Frankia sp. AgB1.8]